MPATWEGVLNRLSTAAAWGALLLVPLGCASGGAGAASTAEDPSSLDRGSAVLEVHNRNWQDMHVYVLAGGQRWSLGMVTSLAERTFDLPDGVFGSAGDIIFLADPVGSVVVYHSDPVLLEPGDRVQWTLQNRLSHSSLFVR